MNRQWVVWVVFNQNRAEDIKIETLKMFGGMYRVVGDQIFNGIVDLE